MDTPPPEERRGPCFRDTVRGDPGKLHTGKDLSPLISQAAPHSTLDASNLDLFDLGGERVPSMATERFARTHSGPEALSSRVRPVGDGRFDLHLNLDNNWRQSTRLGLQMSIRIGLTWLGLTRKGD